MLMIKIRPSLVLLSLVLCFELCISLANRTLDGITIEPRTVSTRVRSLDLQAVNKFVEIAGNIAAVRNLAPNLKVIQVSRVPLSVNLLCTQNVRLGKYREVLVMDKEMPRSSGELDSNESPFWARLRTLNYGLRLWPYFQTLPWTQEEMPDIERLQSILLEKTMHPWKKMQILRPKSHYAPKVLRNQLYFVFDMGAVSPRGYQRRLKRPLIIFIGLDEHVIHSYQHPLTDLPIPPFFGRSKEKPTDRVLRPPPQWPTIDEDPAVP